MCVYYVCGRWCRVCGTCVSVDVFVNQSRCVLVQVGTLIKTWVRAYMVINVHMHEKGEEKKTKKTRAQCAILNSNTPMPVCTDVDRKV